MNGVEAFGFSLGELTHLGGDDLETVGFETGVDLADHVLGNRIGLDDGEGTLNGHFYTLLEGWLMKDRARLSDAGIFQGENFTTQAFLPRVLRSPLHAKR